MFALNLIQNGSVTPIPYGRYESLRRPLGRSVRHFAALLIVAEQIAMERSKKAP